MTRDSGWGPDIDGPLSGMRVAVCGSSPAIGHAARLLASLGAVTDSAPEAWREADGALDATGTLPSGAQIPAVRTVQTSALDDWAASGAMALTGRADGPPLRSPGQPASVAWGALLAAELLARIGGRRVLLPGPRLLAERAAISRFGRAAPISADGTFTAEGVSPAKPEWPFVLNGRRRTASPADGLIRVPRRRWSLPPALVVNLSDRWAHALCAQLLAMTGARVVHVEAGGRFGPPEWWDLLHAGQESVWPQVRGPLLAVADVVLGECEDDGAGAGVACRVRIEPGSGDEAAAEAGLIAFDAEAGVAAPCGDAIAEPLAGINAALAVLACRLAGGHWFAELNLVDQAASALFGALEPGPAASPAPPVARRQDGRAPSPGEHTERLSAELSGRPSPA